MEFSALELRRTGFQGEDDLKHWNSADSTVLLTDRQKEAQEPVMRPPTPETRPEAFGSRSSRTSASDASSSSEEEVHVQHDAARPEAHETRKQLSATSSSPDGKELGPRQESQAQAHVATRALGVSVSQGNSSISTHRNSSYSSLPDSVSSADTVINKSREPGQAAELAYRAEDPLRQFGSSLGASKQAARDFDPAELAPSPIAPPESTFAKDLVSDQEGLDHDSPLHCDTCNVVATSKEQLASHLEGKRHKRFLAMAELHDGSKPAEGSEQDSLQDLHCDLCDVTAPSLHHRQYHLRGQKHQRREKQHWLLEASAELANDAVDALLEDAEGSVERAQAAELEGGSTDDQPLRSPFAVFDEELAVPLSLPPADLPLRLSGKVVRFSGDLGSCSEQREVAVLGTSGAPQLSHLVSSGSFKLVSGGSFSSPAAHFCPVCGIIATSEANLQDHLQGRRHARRLQYLSHMPESERNDQLQRTLTGGSGVFRQGSLVLPSSMDLTAYIGRVAQVHPQMSSTSALERRDGEGGRDSEPYFRADVSID